MAAERRPERHGWAWLSDEWSNALRTPLMERDASLIDEWRANGRPLIVARAAPGDRDDDLRLGLATPDKRRIAVHVEDRAIVRTMPPLPLSDALGAAPATWQPRLTKVIARAAAGGLRCSVYGSLAWTHQSGIRFLNPNSDVDLLFRPTCPSKGSALAFLTELARDAALPRLDGELVLPGDVAIAWREYAARRAEVLVKDRSGPTLRRLADVDALLWVPLS